MNANLRLGQPRVHLLMAAILSFVLEFFGFTNRELGARLGRLLSIGAASISAGRMIYDLMKLNRHGLVKRIPKWHRYRVAKQGLYTALLFTHSYALVLRSGSAHVDPNA